MRRGFSLVEMVTALALLTILVALAVPLARPQRSARTADAGAQLLAAFVRDARQQAVSSGQVTAVGFPSQDGTRPVADSGYLLQGREHPKLQRVLRFAGEGVACQAFLGTYPGPSWSTVQPSGLLRTITLPAGWNPQGDSDPLLAFWPDGTVSANVAHDGGEFRIAVGLALAADTSSPPQLQKAYRPYTVSVSLLGAIEVQPGLPQGEAGLITEQAFGQTAAAPIGHRPGANQDPILIAPQLKVLPEVQSSTLPNLALPGSTATVSLDGMVTVQIYASDPDGDPLSCVWNATGPATGNRFSHPQPTSMDWDATTNCWTQRWSWSPPPGAVAGEQYQLSCTITDDRGGSVSPDAVGVQLPKVQTLSVRKICYVEEADTPRASVAVCNWDGTNPRIIASSARLEELRLHVCSPVCARFSPDGAAIAFPCESSTDGSDTGIYVCAPDGSGVRRLTVNPNTTVIGLEWDPAGRYLYTVDTTALAQVRVLRWEYTDTVDSTPDVLVSWPASAFQGPYIAMHPSGKLMAVPMTGGLGVAWLPTLTNPAAYSFLAGAEGEVDFSKDGHSILVDSLGTITRRPITWNAATHTIAYSGTPVDLTPGYNDLQSPRRSRDGLWILGQRNGARLENFLFEVATGKVMTLSLPDTVSQDGADFGP